MSFMASNPSSRIQAIYRVGCAGIGSFTVGIMAISPAGHNQNCGSERSACASRTELANQRLYDNRTGGYRFEDMPHDREAYRLGFEAINQESQNEYRADFVFLPHLQQELVLKTIHEGEPTAAHEIWKRMSVHRFWQLITSDAIDAYYAHPWAWDEIGFGGPAYPRAYIRLERGEAEPWEVEEQRYDWIAPVHAASAEAQATHEFHIESVQHRSHRKV